MRIVAILVALSTTLALAAATAAQPTRAITSVDARSGSLAAVQCPSVLVLGSRGSGEPATGTPVVSGEPVELGKPVGVFVKALTGDLPGMRVVPAVNPYPAVSVSFLQLAKELVREPLRLSGAYTESVATGRSTLSLMIADEVLTCPSTKLVLAGYSQGAQVTGDVYEALASGASAADKKQFAAIAAVVLFADPDYNHLDPSDVVTAYQENAQAKLRNDGLLVHSPIVRPHSFPTNTRGRVLSYCVATDYVCQGLGQRLLHGSSPHDDYGLPGAPQPTDAAQYIAGRIRSSSGAGVYEVSLGAIAPNHGGLLDNQTAAASNVTPPINPFPYDVSTLNLGEAGCNCVPPLAPASLTLASMVKTSCSSIALKVYSPWAPTDPGGADEVQIVQPGRATVSTEVTSAAQMGSLTAHLSGGPWELTTSELSPADTGDQATVFVRGTLTCSTRSGG